MKTKVSFDKLVYMGVKMVLDCTPVGMAVAVLSQIKRRGSGTIESRNY